MGEWATLNDYVCSLFKEKKTDTPEFKALLRVYGREKLAKIWKDFCCQNGISASENLGSSGIEPAGRDEPGCDDD